MVLINRFKEAVAYVVMVWTLATEELLKAREEQIKEHGDE